MLRVLRNLFKPKPKTVISKPTVERQIVVSKNKKANISPTITKRMSHNGGNIDAVIKAHIRKINKLHQKQVKYGLNKNERAILAEYQANLERIAATREGTKRIFVED